MPPRAARPDPQIERLARDFRSRWVAADGIEPWLRRQLPRLTRLNQQDGWSWSDIGRVLTTAGIVYATGRPWTGSLLARKLVPVRAQLRARQKRTSIPEPTS